MRLLVGTSLILAILGLFLLAHASGVQQPMHLKLSQISGSHEGQLIETNGELLSSYARGGHLFLKICDSSCIDAVIFSKDIPNIVTHETNPWLLSKGDRLTIRGTISIYNNKPEIIVESLKVI